MSSLYRRILGSAFDTLPPSLQRFHDVETEWNGTARFRITRARGWLRNTIANVGGLPRSADDVAVKLRIVAEGTGERWIRHFGEHRLESFQREWRGLLIESFGTLTLGFRLIAEPPALRLEPARLWILGGLPWPRWLGPSGSGEEIGRADGCAIIARAFAPLLGQLVQYEGLVVESATAIKDSSARPSANGS